MISVFCVGSVFSCTTTNSSKVDASQRDLTTERDSILKHQPSIADSIHLWIVPNHMLWIPLEFEDPHALDMRMKKKY